MKAISTLVIAAVACMTAVSCAEKIDPVAGPTILIDKTALTNDIAYVAGMGRGLI